MLHVFGVATLLLYFASAALFILALARRQKRLAGLGRRFLFFAFIAQCFTLCILFTSQGRLGLVEQGDYLFWISWIIALSYLLAQRRFASPLAGSLTACTAALFYAAASLLFHQKTGHPTDELRALILVLHVVPALVAQVALAFALVLSAVFLLQERLIKNRSADALALNTPNLPLLDSMHHRAVLVGFGAMTIAIVSGLVFGSPVSPGIFAYDILSWICAGTWLMLAAILCTRFVMHWPARRIALATVTVACVFFLALIILAAMHGAMIHSGLR